MVKQWNYLASPAFQMRYMVAAGLIRKYRNIIEIGSYKTPILHYIDDPEKNILCIDPMIFPTARSETQRSEMTDYRVYDLEPFGGEPYAMVILGLDLPITYKLKKYISDAEITIIEFPEDHQWKRSRETFEKLKSEMSLHVLSQVHMDFDGNDFSTYDNPDEWPPRTQRYMFAVSVKNRSLDALGDATPFAQPEPALDTSQSRLIDAGFAGEAILKDAAFEFSHGAFGPANYLGGGLLYYCIAYMTRSRVCVCLGSGGAFAPRLMRQAQRDIGLSEHGRTILVDGDRGEFGRPNWLNEGSAFRAAYPDVEIQVCDTAAAAAALAEQGVTIDYLHIDADHSHEGALRDFDAYLPLMRGGALVTFHDTRPNAHASATCWKALDDIRARGFELVNMPGLASGVAIIRV